MEGSFLASSFHPPDIDAAPRYPSWVLLDKTAYFADRDNATTAEAETSTGHTVKVTFCLADPPGVSYFCVHGPGFEREDFDEEPRVVFSAKDLVLLCFAFTVGPRSTSRGSHLAEYYIYRAGRGKPSLRPIPATPPGSRNSSYVSILPCDDGEFLLADLSMTETSVDYALNVFSSKTDAWSATPLKLRVPPGVREDDLPHPLLDKVISLGGGKVGWIDLWRGILVCNVLYKDPVLRFVPIPKLELNERREGDALPVRDVACCNGFIRFVELDCRFKPLLVRNKKTCKMTKDLDTVDVITDAEMLFHSDDASVKAEETVSVDDGWKLRTCYRHTSWDYWRKGHIVDVDDISVVSAHTNPRTSPQLWDGVAGRSSLRNLTTAYPTLGIHGDDMVYLMSKLELHDEKSWIVGVHLGKKAVQVIEPYSAERVTYFAPTFLPCAFSEYLNTTPRPRPPADAVTCAPNGPVLNDHLPSGQNYLPPQQNMWNYNGQHPGYGYGNFQHPPPLWPQFMCPPNLAQPLHPNSTSSRPGSVNPVNTQSIYPAPLFNTAANSPVWLSVHLGPLPLPPPFTILQPPALPLAAPAANVVLNQDHQLHHPNQSGYLNPEERNY